MLPALREALECTCQHPLSHFTITMKQHTEIIRRLAKHRKVEELSVTAPWWTMMTTRTD